MKIQYVSCHAVLEYDEVKLLTELGHEVYSNGCYRDPRGAYTLPRPGIDHMVLDEDWIRLTAEHPKTDLPKEMIDQFDAFIFMSGEREQALLQNWQRIKHKRVIWRTIGQSTPVIERSIAPLVAEGLQVVRCSPKERNFMGYAGESAMIRFYKDPDEFHGWSGEDVRPVNFTQSLQGRRDFCHYDLVMGSLLGYEGAKVYGTGNADLGKFNGGEVNYEHMKEILRKARVFVYTGTWPACYTLSLIEAMMTGTPVVAISSELANSGGQERLDFYEVEDIIENGKSGFICNSIPEMRARIVELMGNDELARTISTNGRARAIELFGRTEIAQQWQSFLNGGGK